uniref:General transcription and DNA repair factor IIH subunit TFB5 n=1 Tax=Saimiri boliviensis boliviensis TaxID=39432 RepID=A0A2K6U3F1_SAIBB
MVNVLKGVLTECDPAMKQFILCLDESSALGKKFIIQDIDDTHIIVIAELVNVLQEKVGELMDQKCLIFSLEGEKMDQKCFFPYPEMKINPISTKNTKLAQRGGTCL